VQDGDGARDFADEVHVVLDHDEGVLAGEGLEKLRRALGLGICHAGNRFVEQQARLLPNCTACAMSRCKPVPGRILFMKQWRQGN